MRRRKRSTAMLPPERITPTRSPLTSTWPDIAAASAVEPLGSVTLLLAQLQGSDPAVLGVEARADILNQREVLGAEVREGDNVERHLGCERYGALHAGGALRSRAAFRSSTSSPLRSAARRASERVASRPGIL